MKLVSWKPDNPWSGIGPVTLQGRQVVYKGAVAFELTEADHQRVQTALRQPSRKDGTEGMLVRSTVGDYHRLEFA